MCRVNNLGGFIMACLTPFITSLGAVIMNKVCIFMFFQPAPGEPSASYFFNLNATGLVIFYIFNLSSILGVVSHFRCAMSDPGTIPQNIYVPEHLSGRVNFCKKGCKTWKPERAHHCSECKQCIMRMDHHCPWVNNCVGIANMKYFMLFLFYIALASGILALGMIGSFFGWSSHMQTMRRGTPQYKQHQKNFAYGFLLGFLGFIIGLVFCLFTFEMLRDQSSVIQENKPGVEMLKDTQGAILDYSQNFFKVFGTEKKWWLLPVDPAIKVNYLQKVFSKNEILEYLKTDTQLPIDDTYDDYDKYEEMNNKRTRTLERTLWTLGLLGLGAFILCDVLLF